MEIAVLGKKSCLVVSWPTVPVHTHTVRYRTPPGGGAWVDHGAVLSPCEIGQLLESTEYEVEVVGTDGSSHAIQAETAADPGSFVMTWLATPGVTYDLHHRSGAAPQQTTNNVPSPFTIANLPQTTSHEVVIAGNDGTQRVFETNSHTAVNLYRTVMVRYNGAHIEQLSAFADKTVDESDAYFNEPIGVLGEPNFPLGRPLRGLSVFRTHEINALPAAAVVPPLNNALPTPDLYFSLLPLGTTRATAIASAQAIVTTHRKSKPPTPRVSQAQVCFKLPHNTDLLACGLRVHDDGADAGGPGPNGHSLLVPVVDLPFHAPPIILNANIDLRPVNYLKPLPWELHCIKFRAAAEIKPLQSNHDPSARSLVTLIEAYFGELDYDDALLAHSLVKHLTDLNYPELGALVTRPILLSAAQQVLEVISSATEYDDAVKLGVVLDELRSLPSVLSTEAVDSLVEEIVDHKVESVYQNGSKVAESDIPYEPLRIAMQRFAMQSLDSGVACAASLHLLTPTAVAVPESLEVTTETGEKYELKFKRHIVRSLDLMPETNLDTREVRVVCNDDDHDAFNSTVSVEPLDKLLFFVASVSPPADEATATQQGPAGATAPAVERLPKGSARQCQGKRRGGGDCRNRTLSLYHGFALCWCHVYQLDELLR
eukprot:m.39317 g.39317  ORF g.39317 m.39317 type:complete len:655 (-) comp11259_c1_seq1:47-2011(-)